MDWSKLKRNLRNNNCVAVIGAGASRAHIPPAKDLAAALLRLESGSNPFTDEQNQPISDAEKRTVEDLAAVAQYLAIKHKQGDYPKMVIADFIKDKCKDPKFADDDPHKALAALNLPIYITTNYDNRMKLALQLQGKEVKTAICRWNDQLQALKTCFDDGYQPTPQHPVVFHLHGQMEIFDSIVVSEDDYLDFLVEMSKQKRQDVESVSAQPGTRRPMFPPLIQTALARNLLLFVGYGIADTNFRVILRGLKTSLRSSAKNSITVQYGGDQREEMKEYLEQYFEWMLDLDVFWGSSEDFAKELFEQLELFSYQNG